GRLGARRAIAVIDAQEILWCVDQWHRSNLGNFGAARGCAPLWCQGEEPSLPGNFSSQDGARLIADRVGIPAIFACGRLCCLKCGKIFDTPKERPGRELFESFLCDRFDDVLLSLRLRWRRKQ